MSISAQQIFDACTTKLKNAPNNSKFLQTRASASFRLGKYDLAILDLDIVLKSHASDTTARLLRSSAFLENHQEQKALQDIDYVLNQCPSHAQALYLKAQIQAQNKDRQQAIVTFQQAIESEHNSKCSESSISSSYSRLYSPYVQPIFDIILPQKSPIQLIKQRIQLHPAPFDSNYFTQLGLDLRKQNKLQEASDAFTSALSSKITTQALLNRAFCYDKLNFLQNAISDYQHVIQIDPKNSLAHHNLGVCYDKLEDFPAALISFNSAIKLDLNSEFLCSRGLTHRRVGDFKSAIADYNQALQLSPNVYSTLFARAYCHELAGDLQSSLSDYNACINLEKQQFALHNRGSVLARLNQHKLAIADFSEAIQLNSGASESFSARGQSYLAMDKRGEALMDFQLAFDISGSVEHGLMLAEALRTNQMLSEALKIYENLLISHQEASIEIYSQRAQIYRKMQLFRESLSDSSKALLGAPNDVKLLINRGFVYAKLQQFEMAISDYSKVLKIDPTNQHALHNRGISLDKVGRQQEAISDFSRAIELNPSDSAAFFSRGASLDAIGKYEEAMADYGRALELEGKVGSGVPKIGKSVKK